MQRTASATQVIAVGKLLDEYYDKEKGAYKEGWNDERVATTANCKVSSVAGVRRALGLHLPVGKATNQELQKIINEQQVMINKLVIAHNTMAVVMLSVGARAMGRAGFEAIVKLAKDKYKSDIFDEVKS